MEVPESPKIYHIVHVDRLASILSAGCLWCDAEINRRSPPGTTIGMSNIKQRRLSLPLTSHPTLRVGDCVPFYFCPRSVMLFLLYKADHPELVYRGGQEPIIHLVADLLTVVAWSRQNNRRWAFTLTNAGSFHFEDRADLACLSEINWEAVASNRWNDPWVKEYKQAEFLLEYAFPWQLIEGIGVQGRAAFNAVAAALQNAPHRPNIEIQSAWYY